MAKKKSRTALSKAKVAPPRVAAKLTPAGNTMDVIDGGDQVRTASQKLAGDLRRGRVVPGKEGSVLQGSLTVPARGFYAAILIFSLTVGFLVIRVGRLYSAHISCRGLLGTMPRRTTRISAHGLGRIARRIWSR